MNIAPLHKATLSLHKNFYFPRKTLEIVLVGQIFAGEDRSQAPQDYHHYQYQSSNSEYQNIQRHEHTAIEHRN